MRTLDQTSQDEATPLKEKRANSKAMDDPNVKLGTAKLITYLREQEFGELNVETNSIYGIVIALPQIGRSCHWPRTIKFLCFRSYMALIFSFVIQMWLVYLINKEELIMNKFAGQMYTCNLGANLEHCPEGEGCLGPGGTRYTPSRLYDYNSWSTRNYVKDALLALFADKADEINDQVDPGEFGVENSNSRFLCLFIFIMSLIPEFKALMVGMEMMWFVPTAEESWVKYEVPDWGEKDHVKNVHNWSELDLVRIRVAGMPLRWKVVNLMFVMLPKLFFWACILSAGTTCLLNTAGINDVIVNSTALGLVLSIDELVFEIMAHPISRGILDRLEAYPLYDIDQHEQKDDHQVITEFQESEARPPLTRRLWQMSRLVPVNAIIVFSIWVFVIWEYYASNCVQQADGTWVSKPMELPRSAALSLGQALFPSIFKISHVPEPYWTMPDVADG